MPTSLLFWDSETVNAGSEITFPIAKFTVPRDTALNVIRWQFSTALPVGQIYVEIRLGREALTAGFVPMLTLVLPDDLAAESAGLYTMQFRKPMRMEAGEYLTVRVQNRGVTNGTVAFTLSTECVSPGTTLIRELPFICAFVDVPRAGGTTAFQTKSTESHLRNPFNSPLFIDRFVGRYLGDYNELKTAPDFANILRQVYVRFADWLGNQIIPANTPFDSIFTPEVKGWVVQTRIPAGAFIIANLNNTTSFDSSAYTTTQSMIGLIGSRSVSVRG